MSLGREKCKNYLPEPWAFKMELVRAAKGQSEVLPYSPLLDQLF